MKIFWFSGTGNSLWTAKKLAYAAKAELVNIADTRDMDTVTVEDDAVGFVFPTYWGDIPRPAKEFLLKLRAPKDTWFFAVMTSAGGDSGVSFLCIDRALYAQGQKLSLARNITMPGNLLKASAKNEKAILKGTEQELKDILWDVFHRTADLKSENKGPGKRFVQQTPFRSPNALIKRFRITEDCDGCGICAQLCPTGNITVTDGKAVHGKNCANCYACRHWCPKAATVPVARMFGKRPQYHHPSIRVKDFLKK